MPTGCMHKLVATVIVYTSKLASRRCIIAYIVLDLSLCIAIAIFYSLFAAIGHICRFTPTWLLSSYWILRTLLMGCGILAVANRTVRFVRLFWFFWMGFNIVSLVNLAPLTMTTCSCDNYFQCWLLTSFTPLDTSGVEFTNPFFPPPAALSCDDSGQCATPSGLLTFTYSSPPKLEDDTDHNFLEMHRQLTHHKKGALFHRQDFHMGLKSNPGPGDSDPVEGFRPTPGICWKGESQPVNDMSISVTKEMISALSCMFYQGKDCPSPESPQWPELRERIIVLLDSCLSRPQCSAVQIELGKNVQRISLYSSLDPVPKSECREKWIEKLFSLQKVKQAGKAQKAVRDLHSMRYYLSFNELTDMLIDDYDAGCWCSDKLSPSGCTFYHDNGKPSFWCYINPLNIESCRRRGYTLHRDGDNFWTHDICNQEPQKACTCSGSGAPPPFDHWNHIPDESLLDGQRGNWKYGSFCAPWDKDLPSWCFVGFDTSCPDRTRVKWRQSGKKRSIHMDASYMACSQQKVQESMDKVGMSRCRFTTSIAIALVVLWFFVGILMQDVAFEFMKNGCGDQVSSSGQYAVGDLSDDEDEWSVKGPSSRVA